MSGTLTSDGTAVRTVVHRAHNCEVANCGTCREIYDGPKPQPKYWGAVGSRLGCPKHVADNNCLFMSFYMSCTEEERAILRGGKEVPEKDIPKAFRECNYKMKPGKKGIGSGYNMGHLFRYLDLLHKTGKIRSYTKGKVKRNWSQGASYFIMDVNKRMNVGDKLILMSVATHSDYKKCKTIEKKFKNCNFRHKRGDEPGDMLELVDPKNPEPVSLKRQLEQECAMYEEITSNDLWHQKKKLSQTHGVTVAYHQTGLKEKNEYWSELGKVPVIYDNGRVNCMECTPASLLQSVYNTTAIWHIGIDCKVN